eukprot:GEMP01040388.1.p1 GENE.GEMP01040388.1~~GEMP01040388.1.p1  ORF type:complete len:481 (+),score=102.92 GEMP01040388.1:48-1490(+)
MNPWCVLGLVAALDVSRIDPHFRDPASQDLSAQAERKIKELTDAMISCDAPTMLYNATGCGVIEFKSSEQYVDFVMTAPRPYDLFVLFAVKRGQCCSPRKGGGCRKNVCSRAEDAFLNAAASYFAQGQRAAAEGDPTFFAIVRCDDEELQDVCTEVHKFDVVPKLVHARSKSFTRRQTVFRFRAANTFRDTSLWPKQDVLDWVNGITGRGVREQIDIFKMLMRMLPLFGILIAGLVTVFVGAQVVRRFPWLMVIAVMIVQWLGCSGLTFNIINGIKWGTPDNYFSDSMRSQFLGEGLLCSGMMTGSGLLLVVAAYLNGKEYRENDKYAGKKIALANGVAMIAIIGAAACVQIVMNIYSSFKAPWYRETPFMPPNDYMIGPLIADRRNSFINYKPVPWFQSHPVIATSAALVMSTKNSFFSMGLKLLNAGRRFARNLDESPLGNLRTVYAGMFDKAYDVVEVVLSPFINIGGKKKKSKKSK